MFDVRLKAGTIIILINPKHPAREHFFDLLKAGGGRDRFPGTEALEAAAQRVACGLRMSPPAPGRKQILEDARADWGRLARDFLQAANE